MRPEASGGHHPQPLGASSKEIEEGAGSRAVSLGMKAALFFAVPHFFGEPEPFRRKMV
jgi:hypothetical protein